MINYKNAVLKLYPLSEIKYKPYKLNYEFIIVDDETNIIIGKGRTAPQAWKSAYDYVIDGSYEIWLIKHNLREIKQ